MSETPRNAMPPTRIRFAPMRSTSKPTRGWQMESTIMATMTAPVSWARFQPNSSDIGLSTTPNRNRAPEAMVRVTATTVTTTQA
jgi:hypothetical protein